LQEPASAHAEQASHAPLHEPPVEVEPPPLAVDAVLVWLPLGIAPPPPAAPSNVGLCEQPSPDTARSTTNKRRERKLASIMRPIATDRREPRQL
jgi:hypothetical protein